MVSPPNKSAKVKKVIDFTTSALKQEKEIGKKVLEDD